MVPKIKPRLQHLTAEASLQKSFNGINICTASLTEKLIKGQKIECMVRFDTQYVPG